MTTTSLTGLPTLSASERRLINEQGRTKLQREIRDHQIKYFPIDQALSEAKAWELDEGDCYVPPRSDALVFRTGIGLDTVVVVEHGLDPFHTVVPADIEVMDLSSLG